MPERPGALAWAVPTAIVVSVLPIVAAIVMSVALVAFFVQLAVASAQQFDDASVDGGSSGPAVDEVGDGPLDLPWDVPVADTVEVRLVQTFAFDPAWAIPGDADPTESSYEHLADGCRVWYGSGSVEPGSFVRTDDRAASAAFAADFLGMAEPQLRIEDATFLTADGEERGRADAVLARVSNPGGAQGALLGRVFGSSEEVAYVYVECADPAAVDALLTTALPERVHLQTVPSRW